MTQVINLRKIAVSLAMFAVITLGSVLTAKADPVTFVLGGADFSGTTNNTGGNITVHIQNIVNGVQISVTNNLVDPGAFLGTLWLSTSVAPLAGTVVACGAAPGCSFAPLPTISFGSNDFQADGAGRYDIEVEFETDLADRLLAGETIVFTITSTTAGFNSDSFLVLPGPGGGNVSFEAAAHIQGLPPNNSQSDFITNRPPDTPIPEPASMLLLGTGLIGLAGAARRRFKK